MTKLKSELPDFPLAQGSRRPRWLYPLLLSMQTAGAVLLCSEVLPIYRQVLASKVGFASNTAMVMGAGMLIQVGYWIRYRMQLAPPRLTSALLGHIVLFAGRLTFLLPTAIFSFLFIAKTLEGQIPVQRYLVILFGQFSLFCYVRELEHLGNCMLRER